MAPGGERARVSQIVLDVLDFCPCSGIQSDPDRVQVIGQGLQRLGDPMHAMTGNSPDGIAPPAFPELLLPAGCRPLNLAQRSGESRKPTFRQGGILPFQDPTKLTGFALSLILHHRQLFLHIHPQQRGDKLPGFLELVQEIERSPLIEEGPRSLARTLHHHALGEFSGTREDPAAENEARGSRVVHDDRLEPEPGAE